MNIVASNDGFAINTNSLKEQLLASPQSFQYSLVLTPSQPTITTKQAERGKALLKTFSSNSLKFVPLKDWWLSKKEYLTLASTYPFLLDMSSLLQLIEVTTKNSSFNFALNLNYQNQLIQNLEAKINRHQGETLEEGEGLIAGQIADRLMDENALLVALNQLTENLNQQLTTPDNPLPLNPNTQHEIKLLVSEYPKTKGEYANQYLEVDLSQQKLYRFKNQKLEKSYIISTGLYSPTPTGVFKIENKFEKAWSPTAQVWMPFWMMFTFNKNLGAYLGFHELPYWEINGQIVRRPFDTLGHPVTGGCIQLNIGDAKEVYDWAEVGIPILIHW